MERTRLRSWAIAAAAAAVSILPPGCGERGEGASEAAFTEAENVSFAAAAALFSAELEMLRASAEDDPIDLTAASQSSYRLRAALESLMAARAGDDAFDAAAEEVHVEATVVTAQVFRVYEPEALREMITDLAAKAGSFNDAHLARQTPAEG